MYNELEFALELMAAWYYVRSTSNWSSSLSVHCDRGFCKLQNKLLQVPSASSSPSLEK